MELTHLENDQLVDYFAGVWTLDQERMIEAHLADCEECSRSARQIYAEIEVFDRWSVQKHRESVPVEIEVGRPRYGYAQAAASHSGIMVGVASGIAAFIGTLFTTPARRQEPAAQRKAAAAEYKTRAGG